jgi:hypothetical protein
MVDGGLEKMRVHPGDPAGYCLVLRAPAPEEDRVVDLNSFINKGLRIEFNGRITCCHCALETRKSYGEGYCYGCFRRLARCDLCVVSPARCHFAQGTCREPAWGEAFCMQPHLVYLANASGAKVGITRLGQEQTRWLDQGAVQALLIASAGSRHLAGVLEAALARHVSDRTDWRAMVGGEPPAVDLPALRDRLRDLVTAPPGVRWLEADVQRLRYPVLRYPDQPARLRLQRDEPIAGRLIGIKGQYLLFEHGVFNVRQHRSCHVRVSPYELPPGAAPPLAAAGPNQLDLFG